MSGFFGNTQGNYNQTQDQHAYGHTAFPQPSGTYGGYPPPSGPPPQNPGYNPGYQPSYAPPPSGYPSPSGPPPAHRNFEFPTPSPGLNTRGYDPPPGPPHHHHPHGGANFPGQQHQQHSSYPGQQYHQQYNSPSNPPPGYRSSGGHHYDSPMGPPPRPPAGNQNYGPQFQGANQQNSQAFFQYSQCNGKKKALCIGINYIGQKNELSGCINDANNIQHFLCRYYGYKAEDIVMLTDDSRNQRQIPTRENILRAMQWLIKGAAPNDSLFFHYSGHGGQTKDLDGDEADGYDEVIYPVDYERNGHIVDDMMHDIMVKPLPPGCRLTAIFDSCHSGSALDLPYMYSTEGKLKEPNLAAEAGQGLLSAVTAYARGDMGGVLQSAMGFVKTATGNSAKADKISKATKTSPADVISWSGCKDSQTSADATEAGQATGAMSFAFISALSANNQQSYQQLLNNIRDILRNKYSQKPQLSSSHPMDTNILFIC